MTDYIERDALMRRIEHQADEWGDDYDAQQILGDVEDFPAADVRPVVRGRWIEDDGWKRWCSICGLTCSKEYTSVINYCPRCGADMRERGDAK